MSLWRSSPRGLGAGGPGAGGLGAGGGRLLAAVTAGFCLGPALAGGLAFAVLHLGGKGETPAAALAFLLVLTPLVSAPFWATLGLAAAFLLHRGAYGALTAAGSGALIGGATGLLTGLPVLAALGAILATFHRFTLALLRPMAF